MQQPDLTTSDLAKVRRKLDSLQQHADSFEESVANEVDRIKALQTQAKNPSAAAAGLVPE